MGLIHKTLGDMRAAIDAGDWKETLKILKEHSDPLVDKNMAAGLARAGNGATEYVANINKIHDTLFAVRLGQVEKPNNDQIAFIKKYLNEAEWGIKNFEEVVEKLLAEGKLQQ